MAAKRESDEKKTAGEDKSVTQQTTKQAEEREEALPTKAEERGETDAKAAADGSSVGAVKDGDSGVLDTDDDFDLGLTADEVPEGALGTVPEKSINGDEYDAPYTYLTLESLEGEKPRTSDSDDAAKDWTAQDAGGEREDEDGNALDPVALVDVQATPGQTFRVGELPNRDVVEAAGINYEQYIAGLPVRADVPDEAPRKGIPA